MTPIGDVPSGYLEWVLKQDFDEDVKHTAFTQLTTRRSNKTVEEQPGPSYY